MPSIQDINAARKRGFAADVAMEEAINTAVQPSQAPIAITAPTQPEAAAVGNLFAQAYGTAPPVQPAITVDSSRTDSRTTAITTANQHHHQRVTTDASARIQNGRSGGRGGRGGRGYDPFNGHTHIIVDRLLRLNYSRFSLSHALSLLSLFFFRDLSIESIDRSIENTHI